MRIFYNCHLETMSKEETGYTAFSVENGKINGLYKTKPIRGGEYTSLNGAYVFPGFIDTHTHSVSGGIYSLGVNLENCLDLAELFERLTSGRILGDKLFAWHLEEMELKETRFPTAEELDKIFPQMAVLIRRVDGHSCVINTYAARQMTHLPLFSESFDGHFRGRLNDQIVNWFHSSLDEESILQAYDLAAAHAIRYGHTTVHTMVGDGYNSLEHFELLQANLARFPVEFILYAQCFNLEAALKAGAKRLGGCILADGSFGSHTAALFEPYADQPDNRGILYHPDSHWQKLISEAHAADLQFAVHCIGDRAISQILKYYHEVQEKDPKDLRHILIHNELTSDAMIAKMAESHIAAAMQPMFDRLWAGEGGLYQRVLGSQRTSQTNRLRSLRQSGVIIGGGSDWYVTEMDALAGIDAATRMHNPAESLSPFEAIELYTANAAWLSHDENRLGKLLPGYQADFVILGENPLTSASIKDIEIKAVYKSGEKVSL